MTKTKTICVLTLGCRVNSYESESIVSSLQKLGYNVITNLSFADYYVINTCAVTNEAERKSRGYISKCLKLNPKAKIYICGCASEKNPESFKTKPNVEYVIGTSAKLKIVDKIAGTSSYGEESDKLKYDDTYSAGHTRARANIKIQDGCNNFCTYCIIPYLRGRERSRSLDSINNEIDRLEQTTSEIVITGINTSSYGRDLTGQNISLIDVAKLFVGRNVKFRFSSLEVGIITDSFLKALKNIPEFQQHFHLSMQSGSDSVLKSMNRKYTSKQYLEKVNLIRKYFPDAGITTDVIVAFPTETKENFEETIDTCSKANFLWIHVFPYSKRDGTVAAKYKNINDGIVSSERVQMLTNLACSMRDKFIIDRINKEYDMIVEQSKDGYIIGHTTNFIKCYARSNIEIEPNKIIKVKIKKVQNDGALCEIL